MQNATVSPLRNALLFYINPSTVEKLQRLVGEMLSSINQDQIKLQRHVAEILKQSVFVMKYCSYSYSLSESSP